MAKYLVKFSDTVGDIEVNGFRTMTDKEVEFYEELAASITWDFTYSVGFSNDDEDGMLFFSTGDDLLSKLDFIEVSNDEYKTLNKLFNNEFGVFINDDFLKGVLGEEKTTYEDDEDEDGFTNDLEDDEDY